MNHLLTAIITVTLISVPVNRFGKCSNDDKAAMVACHEEGKIDRAAILAARIDLASSAEYFFAQSNQPEAAAYWALRAGDKISAIEFYGKAGKCCEALEVVVPGSYYNCLRYSSKISVGGGCQ